MNTYRITYSIGGPETDTTELIERSEQAARKAFKVFCKSGTITDIALTRTGVAATKQQERDTLAAIRQMVEELGPDSYVATALEGCFEIAEWNIDSDAADSLKGRLEMAEEKIAQGVEELQQARKDLGEARADAERLKIANDELAFRLPAADDLTDCIALAKDRASEHSSRWPTRPQGLWSSQATRPARSSGRRSPTTGTPRAPSTTTRPSKGD